MKSPKERAIQLVEGSIGGWGDNLYRAESAFRGLTPERMQENYGQSGQTRQSIVDGYKKGMKMDEECLAWVRECPEILGEEK